MKQQDMMAALAEAFGLPRQMYNDEIEVTDPEAVNLIFKSWDMHQRYRGMAEAVQAKYEARIAANTREAEKDPRFMEIAERIKTLTKKANDLGEHIEALVKEHEGLEGTVIELRGKAAEMLAEMFPDGGKFIEACNEELQALETRHDMEAKPLKDATCKLVPDLIKKGTQMRVDADERRAFYRTVSDEITVIAPDTEEPPKMN